MAASAIVGRPDPVHERTSRFRGYGYDTSIDTTTPHTDARIDAGILAAFADVAASLYASEVLDDALARLTDAAVRVVDGCEMASVSLLDNKSIRTTAATDPVAELGDRIQYATGQGPCLQVMRGTDGVVLGALNMLPAVGCNQTQ